MGMEVQLLPVKKDGKGKDWKCIVNSTSVWLWLFSESDLFSRPASPPPPFQNIDNPYRISIV